MLAGTVDDFSLLLWGWLLQQTELTVNLLQQLNVTPNVTAYAHLSGPFDYNKIPLAPMRCAVQVHEKIDKRHVVVPLSRQMVSIHVPRALTHPHVPRQSNKEQEAYRHSAV